MIKISDSGLTYNVKSCWDTVLSQENYYVVQNKETICF